MPPETHNYPQEALSMPFQEKPSSYPKSPPRRRLRNYILDSHFQLKYAGMVMAITACISGLMGAYAYHYSQGQTEALGIQIAMQPELHPEVQGDLHGWARAQDRKVALAIILGIVILSLAMGVTTVVVTHRVVGPAYRLKKTFATIAKGQLAIDVKLRKGDELQDVFHAFEQMVDALRERRESQLQNLDTMLLELENKQPKVKEQALAVQQQIREELDRSRA